MPKSNRITILLLVVFILSTALMETVSAQNAIDWQSYTKGMNSAQKNNKAVFLHFYATWCSYCEKMEKESFQNDSIAEYLNNNFLSIRVDVDKERNVADKYNVFALPTTYFFTSSGEKIRSVPGYISKDRLMTLLKKI